MYYAYHPQLYYCPACGSRRAYEEIDSNLFQHSANEMKKLLIDVEKVIEKLASSKNLSEKIMNAAQYSDMGEVERLIYSIGITSELSIRYNPESLHLEFNTSHNSDNSEECCKLILAFRWR
ncbi:hypothetical protein [Halobacillus campisalis]|uniref:Uncharacterized protein n=1 Tax=Halobacillus campisalis TaxID=435909 RepID=A0ABW2K6A6_9BACI|nr:hypothetical protein [Halobacillus campisalis]